MNRTLVDEPLAWVEARFEKGAISPTAFRWGPREFRVSAVHARWVDRAARPVRHGFSVGVEQGGVMELSYREGDPVWRLVAVAAS